MTTAVAPSETTREPAGAGVPESDVRRIPLEQVHESPLNPRSHYDAAGIEELADSLLQTGQLTPAIVRPRVKGGYELAAGHRRLRALKRACEKSPDGVRYRGLFTIEAKVVEGLTDDIAFVEVLNIENLQRDDLHPLEEAKGFADLIKYARYDAAKIAARVGRSEKYVYDRLKLLTLIPEARKLFSAGKFEAGHAILLARLSAADQKLALGEEGERGDRYSADGGGLWEHLRHDGDQVVNGELEFGDDADGYKAVSVREFEHWINDHVRARRDTVDPFLFPETKALIEQATLEKEKVVAITYDSRVPDAARDEKEKTFGSEAWHRADGKFKSKTCDHSVIGLVVAGPDRNEAIRVCVRNERCRVHWLDRVEAAEAKKKAEKRALAPAGGDKAAADRAAARELAAEAKRKAEQAHQAAEAKRLALALPAILKVCVQKIRGLPVGKLIDLIIDEQPLQIPRTKHASLLARGTTADEVLRWLAYMSFLVGITDWRDEIETDRLTGLSKQLGVNWEKIRDEVAPKPAPEKKPVQTSAKAKGKKGKVKK